MNINKQFQEFVHKAWNGKFLKCFFKQMFESAFHTFILEYIFEKARGIDYF